MKNYTSLKQFSKSFNITHCYYRRFMKRKGGYVFQSLINNNLVDVVITPLDKDNQPVVFCGSHAKKTIQALQEMEKINFKIILAVAK